MFLKWRTMNSKTWDMAVTAASAVGQGIVFSVSTSVSASPGKERSVLEGSSNIISKVDLLGSLLCAVVVGFFPSIHHWTGTCSHLVQVQCVCIWSADKLPCNHSSVPGKHTKTVFYWATRKSEAALEAVRAVPLQPAALSVLAGCRCVGPGSGTSGALRCYLLRKAALRAMRYPVLGEGPAVTAEAAFPRAACGERRICSRARGAPARHHGAALTNAVPRTAAAGPGLTREGALAVNPQRPRCPPSASRSGPVGGGWAAVGAGAQLFPAEAVGGAGTSSERSPPLAAPPRRAARDRRGRSGRGAGAAAGRGRSGRAGRWRRDGSAAAAAMGWVRAVLGGSRLRPFAAAPLRGCDKAVEAAGGEEKAAFVARKTGQGERAGAAGKGDGQHPGRRAAAGRAGPTTGTKPLRSAARPRGGSLRGAAVAAPLCRFRTEAARGAGRREAEPRGARSRWLLARWFNITKRCLGPRFNPNAEGNLNK